MILTCKTCLGNIVEGKPGTVLTETPDGVIISAWCSQQCYEKDNK